MVMVTARAKPRDGWSTSLRNDDDDDDSSDDDSSSSSSGAAAAARGQGSDWDWNWSCELIDIGLVDEPTQLRFVETPFTLAKRNALTTSNRAAEAETVANNRKKKKLATTPAASAAAAAKESRPRTSTTTPALHQSAALKKKKKQDTSPSSNVQQRAAPPSNSQASSLAKALRSTPIAQQQSHVDAASSKARLVSSSRFRPASTSSPTVFSSSSSSHPPSTSNATDQALLATATETEPETEHEQAPLASVHCHRPAAGLAMKSPARVKHPVGSSADLIPTKERLPRAASSTYPVGTGGNDLLAHASPPSQAKSTTLPCSSSKPVCAPVATAKDDTNNDTVESPCLAPPPRRRRGDDEMVGVAAAPKTFAAPVNVDNKLPPTAKPNKSNAVRCPPPPPPPPTNLPFVSPLVGKRRPLKLQQSSPEEDAASPTTASTSSLPPPQQRQGSRNSDSDLFLLPRMHTRQVLPSQVQDAAKAPPSSFFSTAGPSSSGRTPSSSSTTTTTTELNSRRTTHRHEGISPETRKRLNRFKRVGNFSSSSSFTPSSTAILVSAAVAAAGVETDPGRLLPISRRDDDDGPSLDPTTPMPGRTAPLSGGPVNDDSNPRSPVLQRVSTKFSLPGFGTAEGSSSDSSILQMKEKNMKKKKKRSRLDFTPDEPLEVFQQKKKNAHGLSSSSSPFSNDDGAWNGEPVSPTPVFPTGGPSQRRQQQRHQVQAQPRRETIVLGTAVRSVRPVSLAATATTGNNSLRRLGKSLLSSSSGAPKKSQPGGFKRPLAAARTRGDFSIHGDNEDDDGQLSEARAKHESEDAKRRRLYRGLGL